MRNHDFRWLVVFAANLLLGWLTGIANDFLGSFSFLWIDHCSFHLYLGGLLVTFAALRLDLRHGFTSTLLTGLAVDATMPVPFGTSLFLFGLVHAVLFYGRKRFPREEVVFAVVVALLANLFLFLALSFLLVGRHVHPGAAWLRLFGDLFASQLAIVLVTPWFTALQARAFALVRLHPETGRPFAI